MMKLPSGWYAVLDSLELRDKPLGVRRFGIDMVFWRYQGKPVAMADTCPHRSAKLSLGRINGCIVCPFHGFEFSAQGDCRYVPETEKAASNLAVKTFPSREEHGFIWVKFLADSAASASHSGSAEPGSAADDIGPNWFEELRVFAPGAIARGVSEWPVHISRCIENQLDYAHLPYVHGSTIGRGVDIRGERNFQLSEQGIKLGFSEAQNNSGYFHFLFPNIWTLCILPGRFHQMIAFVPVSENHTKIYLRAYQNFVAVPGLRALVNAFIAFQNQIILNQDKLVVLSQRPGNSLEASGEKLYPSDRGIVWFRKIWLEKMKSQSE